MANGCSMEEQKRRARCKLASLKDNMRIVINAVEMFTYQLMAPPGTIGDVKVSTLYIMANDCLRANSPFCDFQARQEADLRRLQMEAQIRENQPTRPT